MKQRLLNFVMAIFSTSFIKTSSIIAIAFLAAMPQLMFARELTEIEADGKLKIAVKNNVRPLGFTDEKGNLVGLEIDISRKLAEEVLGDSQAVEFLSVNNKERLQVILEDEVDLAIARVSVTTPRARIVDFSPYYYLDGTGIITNKPEIENLEDLSNNKIAVIEKSGTIAIVRNRLPNADLVGVESYQEALELIEAGKADAFAGDRSILTGWVQEYPSYTLLPARLSGAALAVVMPKGLQYQELRTKIDRAIAEWKKSGWLKERIEYWGL